VTLNRSGTDDCLSLISSYDGTFANDYGSWVRAYYTG
jgi:hypothetical protein